MLVLKYTPSWIIYHPMGNSDSVAWLNLSALRGMDEEFGAIVKDSAFIDGARRDALCYGLRKRVELLQELVRSRENSERKPRKPDCGAKGLKAKVPVRDMEAKHWPFDSRTKSAKIQSQFGEKNTNRE
jgi:hypothetical protein